LQRLKLNLATISYREARLRNVVVGMVVIIVAVITALLVNATVSLDKEVHGYQKRIHALRKELSRAREVKKELTTSLSKADIEKLGREINFITNIVMLDIFPWNLVLSSLERTIPKGILLNALYSSGIEKPLVLKGQADSMAQISVFLRNLDNAKEFSKSALVKFSVEPRAVGASNSPIQNSVSFEIECGLNRDYLLAVLNSGAVSEDRSR